jgi:hypothetical protein
MRPLACSFFLPKAVLNTSNYFVFSGANKAAILFRIFVPLCASFVPWSFCQGLVVDAEIRGPPCQSYVFSSTGWECFETNEKAR